MSNFLTKSAVGSRVDYTPNIFICSWGVNPTDTIPPKVSTIIRRAYDPIRFFQGFFLQSNHKRLRLKRINFKRIRFEELLSRIRQDAHDYVVDNACYPADVPDNVIIELKDDEHKEPSVT